MPSRRPLRILYLNHNVARRGGTYYRALAFARHLARLGHDLTLLTISPRRRFGFDRRVENGVEIIESPDLFWGQGRSGWDLWDAVNRIAWLRRREWDVVHAWDTRPVVILPALWARRTSVTRQTKLVIDWCDWWGRGGTQVGRPGSALKALYHPVETFFEERFRRYADRTTVISRALEERVAALGIPRSSVHRLPQGCDVVATPLDRRTARSRLNLPDTAPVLLSVGRLLVPDAALLFAALRIICRRIPGCRVLIVGEHGTVIPDDLRPFVRDCGFVCEDELTNMRAACDALLVPLDDSIASRARWPSKVNPFLAEGRIVVISRVGDLPELMSDAGAGIAAAPGPDNFAQAVVELLANPDRRPMLEDGARGLAEKLAWTTLTEGLEAVYCDALAHDDRLL